MSKSLNKSDKSLLTKTVYSDYGLPFSGAIYNREGLKFPNARTNVKSPYVSVKNIIDPRQCELATQLTNKFGKKYRNKFGNIWYPSMYIDLNYNPEMGGYINANGPIGPYFAQGLGDYPRSMYRLYNGHSKSAGSKKLNFGTDRPNRPGTPEPGKRKPKTHILIEDDDVYSVIDNIPVGDFVQFIGNAQGNSYIAEVDIDEDGDKTLTNYQFESEFGKYRGQKGLKSPKRSKGPKGPKGPKGSKIVYCLPKEQKFPVNTKKRCSAALSYARYAPEPCQIARCVQKHCKKYPTVGKYSKLIKDCERKRKSKKSKK